ncbi:hypothetical protein [Streptomyces echinatus]|uniref:hypothetical protein n=1 Tax=Streptomyces echinatus TaxID=67293 RepID=UPI0037AB9831
MLLAVLVLAARTPSETGVVEIRARELGRWLGLSESRVRHAVVPGLRRSGVVEVNTLEGEFGQDWGLECRVLPMWEAQGQVGHPLALTKPELATFLRLLEALMAPGWVHGDGSVTPAGLLGGRTGHGASRDRLALLLLVLVAGETGRVPLCGGQVNKRYGRPVATLARLLGFSLSQAERVLERLEEAGLVARPRRRTRSGLKQVSRLVVPLVAAAHGGARTGSAGGRRREGSGVADGRAGVGADLAGTAWPYEDSSAPAKPQAGGSKEPNGSEEEDLATTTALHTDHSSVADVVSKADVRGGFSGSAASGSRGRPERAGAHEVHVPNTADAWPQQGCSGPEGPLRGENQTECAGGVETTGRGARRRWLTVPAGAHRLQQRRQRVAELDDLPHRSALAPVAWLWSRLGGGQQAVALRATDRALEALSGIVGPESAPQVLAARLTDRLYEVGGEAPVRDPMGWLLGRGLVQRPACSDLRCDDGIRLDTSNDCPTCGNIVYIRRALRAQVAARVKAETPDRDPATYRTEVEQRLRKETVLEEARAQIRRARVEREVEERQLAIARRRAIAEDAELARRQAPCADCGLPECAGLCPACSYRRRTEGLLREAVDLAVAVRADLTDAAAVDELTQQCETGTRALLDTASERACGRDADPALVAFTAPQLAQQLRDERREAALRRLLRSQEVVAEADAAYEAYLRHRGRGAEEAAEHAADAAGRRAAEFLLRQRLDELHAARQRCPGASGHTQGLGGRGIAAVALPGGPSTRHLSPTGWWER